MSVPYAEFLTAKRLAVPASGIDCTPDDIDSRLHGFQRYTTAWSVRRGRSAVKLGRAFTGIELKPSYWQTAVANLQAAERDADAPLLFDLDDVMGPAGR